MGSTRRTIVLLTIIVGSMGAFWAAFAQDAQPPWPPPPIRPPPSANNQEPPQPQPRYLPPMQKREISPPAVVVPDPRAAALPVSGGPRTISNDSKPPVPLKPPSAGLPGPRKDADPLPSLPVSKIVQEPPPSLPVLPPLPPSLELPRETTPALPRPAKAPLVNSLTTPKSAQAKVGVPPVAPTPIVGARPTAVALPRVGKAPPLLPTPQVQFPPLPVPERKNQVAQAKAVEPSPLPLPALPLLVMPAPIKVTPPARPVHGQKADPKLNAQEIVLAPLPPARADPGKKGPVMMEPRKPAPTPFAVDARRKEPAPALAPKKKEPAPLNVDPANMKPVWVVDPPKNDPVLVVDPPVQDPILVTDPLKKAPLPLVITPMPDPLFPPLPRDAGQPLLVNSAPVEPAEPKAPPRPPPFRLVNPLRPPSPDVKDVNPSPSAVPLVPSARGMKHAPLETVLMAGAQAAQMVLEKRGPDSVRMGQPIPYVIVIRNAGTTTATQLRVEDEIPAGTTVAGVEPAANRVGNRLIWTLDALPPGAEKQLRVELTPQRAGDLTGDTLVNVMLAISTRTRVVGGPDRPVAPVAAALHITVVSPGAVRLAQPANFEVQVVNQGRERLIGLVLQAALPPGLKHPLGDKIEAEVGNLEAGAKKSFTIPTKARSPGRQVIQVHVIAQNGQEAEGLGEVLVTAQGLKVQQAPTTRLLAQRDGELRLEVTNHEARPLQNITVTNLLPPGLEFVEASDRGIYRQESRTVYWLLERLSPEQTQTLVVKVQASKSGQFINQVLVRAQHVEDQRSSSEIQVEGLTDLVIKIAKRDDALEMGKDTVYEVRIQNQGSSVLRNTQLQLSTTEGLTPKQALGPVGFRMQGQQVVFAAMPELPPGGQAVFHLSARGDSVGDRRLRAQVTCDQLRQPLTKEERTWVYKDR